MSRNFTTVAVLAVLALLPCGVAVGQPGFSSGPERFPPTAPGATRREAPSPPPASEQKLYQPAQVIARVGDQPIFLGDLLGPVNQSLEPFVEKYPKEVIKAQRTKMIRQLLTAQLDTKMLYLEFLNTFPQPEGIPEILNTVHDQFNRDQLDRLIEGARQTNPAVTNAADFDAYLRRYGSSLQKTRRNFTEQALGQQQLSQHVNFDPEVTHQDMLDYYLKNIKEYETPAEVRWEQIMVRFGKFPDKRTAYNEIRSMYNQIYFGGKPLAAVAKERSHGLNADKGGLYDWTRKGSLSSPVLEKAIFQFPLGRLSPILETQQGFHVVQVRERREADRIAFKAPDHITLVRQSIRENLADIEILAELENSSGQDTTVELSLYFYDANKKMHFQQRQKVNVPRVGSTTATFKLDDPRLKALPNENIKLSIEPQVRIKQLLRQQKIKQDRDEYIAKLRKIYKPWTIFDQEEKPNKEAASSQSRDDRNATRPFSPPGGSFRPQ